MDTPDDRRLLAAAGQGDRTALDTLIRRHAPLVLAACRRQLPAADADDAAQAVFLVLWRRPTAAAAAPGLPGWLVVTARNVCANARRSAQRRQHAERSMPPPDQTPPANEARALLDEALASLPAPEREAVIRRHLLGEDPLTVAHALACAEGTVHSRTSRGLERLRTWFARRGIACTTASLLALCAGECAAGQLADAAALSAAPSAAAQRLATASTPALLATFGVPLMSLAALSLAAALIWTRIDAVAPPDDTPAPRPTTRMYDISDLYDQSVLLVAPPVGRLQREDGKPIPHPTADPAIVASLDASRRLDELTTGMQAAAGGRSLVRLIDAGMSDEDLRAGQPADEPDLAPYMRLSLSHSQPHAPPGMGTARTMLVRGDELAHARIEAHLHALHELRHARLTARIQAVGAALTEEVQTLYRRDWFFRDEKLLPHAPLTTTIAAPTGHAFVVLWLPEGVVGQDFTHPLAIATDGACCLLVTSMGPVWQPGTRPAAIALYLRQQLDGGRLHAPLRDADWLEASGKAVVVRGSDDGARLAAGLAELLARAAQPPAPF